jgi:ABC-type transporter Mla MlaB component
VVPDFEWVIPALKSERVGNGWWLPGEGDRPLRGETTVLSPEFNIVVGLAGDDAVEVSVSGDLDPDTLGRLRAVLYGILRAGHRRVVVDLARINAVDGSAKEMLAKILKRARAQGGDMVVHWSPA